MSRDDPIQNRLVEELPQALRLLVSTAQFPRLLSHPKRRTTLVFVGVAGVIWEPVIIISQSLVVRSPQLLTLLTSSPVALGARPTLTPLAVQVVSNTPEQLPYVSFPADPL